MSITLRSFAVIAACAFAVALPAAEKTIIAQGSENFKAVAVQGRSWNEDNVLKLALPNVTEVTPKFILTPGKSYTLSAEVCAISGAGLKNKSTSGIVAICLCSTMKSGKKIESKEMNRIYSELAEVVQPVKLGDSTIIVKGKLDEWLKLSEVPVFVAVGAKDDNSDLPNNNLIKLSPSGVKKLATGQWEIKIEEAGRRNIQQDIPAGTKLGLHYYLNIYDFVPFKKAGSEWTKFSGTLNFSEKDPTPVTIGIYCDDNDGQIAVRNLKVVEK